MYTIIAIIIFLIFIALGYHHGFLRRVLSLISVFVAGIIAWFLSSKFHAILPIFPKEENPFSASPLESLTYKYLDQILWFVVIFLFISIALIFLKVIFKKVNKVPLIGGLNRLLGAVLGFIEAFLIIGIACTFLKLPIVDQRYEILNSPVVKQVDHINTTIFFRGDFMDELDTLNKMINGVQISVDEKEALINKGVDLGISRSSLEEFLEKY